MKEVISNKTDLDEQVKNNSEIIIPFVLGMAVNIISILLGNPYTITLICLAFACIITFIWTNKPFSWIVLVSILAANPGNNTTTIAVNLLFSAIFLILNIRHLQKLPRVLFPLMLIALFSVLSSVLNWNFGNLSGEIFLTQGANLANYVLAPFLLIPLIFSRIRAKDTGEQLLKVLVFCLILPSIIYLLAAYLFGTSVSAMDNVTTSRFNYKVNVGLYRMWNMEFGLIRTQVGFILAAAICASFAVLIGFASTILRVTAAACLIGAGFLLLATGSVGSTLAAISGLGLMLLVGKRFLSFKRYALIAITVVAFAVIAWSLLPEGVQKYAESRYLERFSDDGIDTSDRTGIWMTAINFIIDYPMGIGWSLPMEAKMLGFASHNDYLAYAISYGIPCGIIYLFLPFWLLFSLSNIRTCSFDPARLTIALAGVGVVTCLFVNSFSDHLAANRWYFNVIWSIVWFAYFASKRTSRPVPNS